MIAEYEPTLGSGSTKIQLSHVSVVKALELGAIAGMDIGHASANAAASRTGELDTVLGLRKKPKVEENIQNAVERRCLTSEHFASAHPSIAVCGCFSS
jgi:hypothetical protein